MMIDNATETAIDLVLHEIDLLLARGEHSADPMESHRIDRRLRSLREMVGGTSRLIPSKTRNLDRAIALSFERASELQLMSIGILAEGPELVTRPILARLHHRTQSKRVKLLARMALVQQSERKPPYEHPFPF